MENIQHKQNIINKYIERYYVILYLILLILLIFNIFYKINVLNINFDEARHGISAYEMLNKKQYIVNTFLYKNDYWNLKPILSFLPIMLGFKIAGINMLGLRLFSCISTLLTIIVVTIYTKYKHGKLASLISFTLLTTNVQYIIYHCSRSAEADAVYILFFTLSVICISLWERKIFFIYLSALFCSFAFLTKSFHVISLIAILGAYLFLSGNFRKLRISQWLLLLLSFVVPILLWGSLRFHQDGLRFFENMINYDLLNRSENSIEGHTGGVFYYLLTLLRYHGCWIILLIASALYYAAPIYNNIKKKSNVMLICLWIVLPFILYTIAKTKIEWYILPIYPPIAICCGALFSKFLMQENHNRKVLIALVSVFLIIVLDYQVAISYIVHNYNDNPCQTSIRKVSELHIYNNYNLYTTKKDFHDKGIWSQTDILATELYGNFNAKNGGFRAFSKDRTHKALLIAPENSDTWFSIKEHSLKIAARTNGYLFLTK